ncbi:MAG: cytochrome c [Methylobacter sp.]|nr:cytochrome c [Methylobacter sp.]
MPHNFKAGLEIKMIRYWFSGLIVFVLSINPAVAENGTGTDMTRGAMLYDNHCIQCHTQEVHWREKRMATDWESLIAQVDRWQRTFGLEWSKNDIKEVSRYLNSVYYHYP